MHRVTRKNIAWLCLGALLFMQLAVAAYATPTGYSGTPTMEVGVPAALPCQATDLERPKLCEQHCVYASQSVGTQSHTGMDAPVLPLVAIIDHWNLDRPVKSTALRVRLTIAVDPPPLVRFGVLRI